MTIACSCNYGLGNSKTPNCEPLAGVAHGLIFVPTYTSAGVTNKLNLSTFDFDQTAFEALCANSDRYLRWRPLVSRKMEEVEINRADAKMKSFASGSKYFIQDGEMTFKAFLPKLGPGMVNFLDSARCDKVSVYIVDRNGALVGNTSEAGYLRPFRIADHTLDGQFKWAKDDDIAGSMIRFDFDGTESDSDIGIIEASEMSYDIKLLTGLYDVRGVFSSITSTGFVVDLQAYAGKPLNPTRVTGMVITDFTLTNRATAAAITITTVTESTVTPGVYTFVIPTNASKKLKLNGTYTGYDFNILSTQILETPA